MPINLVIYKMQSCHPDNQKLRIAELLRLKGLKFKRFKVHELKRARLDVFVRLHLDGRAKRRQSCHPDNQKLRIAEFLRLKGLKFNEL